MATNSREARRRKIMERGSDRLALITGRIQTLPSSSSSSPDPTTHQEEDTDPPSSQPSISHHQDPQTSLPDQIPVLAPEIEEILPEFDSVVAEQRQRELDARDEQIVRAIRSEARSPSSSSSISSLHRVFTANAITRAIESSEKTRISISVLVAMLVVLTQLGFPLLGGQMVRTLLGFRPLYLVLVTNVTLVLVRIFETARPRLAGMSAVLDGIKMPVSDGYEWADRLGRSLQAVMVMKKVLDALFMDCAVYAILVVCGLSFSTAIAF